MSKEEGLLEDPQGMSGPGSTRSSGDAREDVTYLGQDDPSANPRPFEASSETTDATTSQSYTTDTDQTVVSQGATTEDTGYVQTGRTDTTDEDTMRVQRYEEELQAQKTEREAGAVRVSKDVEEQQQTLEVPVTREEVYVERRAVDRPVSDAGEAFQGGTVEVPLREEDVQVRKEARVAEEFEISKQAVQETERVSDTVRSERVNVEEVGDVDVERRSDNPLDEDVRARE